MKEIEEKFMTQAKFSALVESVVKESNGLVNYIEAVTSVCDEFEIEVETVVELEEARDRLTQMDQHVRDLRERMAVP